MERLLIVSLAGALGTASRYLIGLGAVRWLGDSYPYGTLTVNLVGCFLMAAVMQVASMSHDFSPTLRLTLTTGFMGGLTTYSAFNYESTKLLSERGWLGVLNLGLTLVGCFVMGLLGTFAARRIVG
jgi:fluoride exporter